MVDAALQVATGTHATPDVTLVTFTDLMAVMPLTKTLVVVIAAVMLMVHATVVVMAGATQLTVAHTGMQIAAVEADTFILLAAVTVIAKRNATKATKTMTTTNSHIILF